MSIITGIDLGTCFSVVAQFDETGNPTIVHNANGINLTPSCVWFESPEKVTVGVDATHQWILEEGSKQNEKSAAARFKTEMGLATKYELCGQEYSARDLSALVLKKLVKETSEQLGSMGSVVVTIPANFGHPARVDTAAAANQAGIALTDAGLLNEPTAAALYYAFKEKGAMHGRYAVYDLGGGTFDITLMKVDGYNVEILETGGIHRLGGDDFDKCLRDLVRQKYSALGGGDLPEEVYTKADAEELKIRLSQRSETEVSREISLKGAPVSISRSEFEAAISSKLFEAEMLCEDVLRKAGLKPSDLDGVLLAGGSTRMPCIRESVERFFGRSPDVTANPDEVVALGAAVYAALKSDRSKMSSLQKRAVGEVKLSEITGHHFGTVALSVPDGEGAPEEQNCILIPKSAQVPVSVTRPYYTVAEGQDEVICKLTECNNADETDLKWVTVIAQAPLNLPPGRPANQQVDVTYSVDESNILHAKYVDVASGEQVDLEVDITPSMIEQGTSPSKIDRFLVE